MSSLSIHVAETDHGALVADAAAQVEALLAPICAEMPAGSDSSYHDAQLAIRHELDKLQSLTGQVPRWPLVLAECDRLLRSETKDLTLASFLTVALFELHELAGLSLGLRVIAGIAERFWESAWPPRARVKQRANTLQWAIEHIQASGSARVWSRADAADLVELECALHDFCVQMRQRFGASTLDLQPLRGLIERVRASTNPVDVVAAEGSSLSAPSHARPECSSPSPPAVLTPSSAHALADGSPETSFTTLAHVPTSLCSTLTPTLPSASEQASVVPGDGLPKLHALARSVIELAQARFERDRTDPLAYAWLRRGLWLPWDQLPTAGLRGRTELSPPNRKLQQALHTSLREQRWEAALEQAEQLCRHNPFWLEGHWLSASTLEKLGEAYSAAKACLELEVRAFVRRLPRLCMLQFSDGSPICPPAVSAWLAVGSHREAVQAPDLQTRPVFDDDVPSALVQTNPDALTKLREQLGVATDGRTRFLLTFELAQALQAAGQVDAALTLYLALERELDERRLWRWETAFCTQILRAIVTLMSSRSPHGVTGSDDGELRKMRVRLAQIDPASF